MSGRLSQTIPPIGRDDREEGLRRGGAVLNYTCDGKCYEGTEAGQMCAVCREEERIFRLW